MKYIYIKSKSEIVNKIALILEIISESLNITKYENDELSLTVYYDYTNLSIESLTTIIMSELYEDIIIYESLCYKKIEEMKKSLITIKQLFNEYSYNSNYINNKEILKTIKIDQSIKKLILNQYYNDPVMILTIKTFLETNQNISQTSDLLYLHRNTLSQRLNKFKEATDFDVKKFIDGYLIYKLLLN